MKKYIIYLWTLPIDLIIWLIILIVYLYAGRKLHYNNGLWCELNVRPKRFAGITLGHGGLLCKDFSATILHHELIHVEQYEAISLLCCLIAILTGLFYWSLYPIIIYLTGFYIAYGASCIVAWLRGEKPYYGNIFEESAYSQVKGDNDGKRIER